jgi:hypothetical protein
MFAFTIIFCALSTLLFCIFVLNYKMKRFLGIILAIIFFAACSKSLPEGIFSEKKMTDILFDIHLADGYMYIFNSDTLNKQKPNAYLSLYEKYNTDSAQIRENLQYYSEHPQVFQDIYAEVSKRLQNTEQNLLTLEREKQRATFKLDSINAQRKLDSLNLRKRDSILLFNGKRDLFLVHTDSLADSLAKSHKVDSLFQPIINEQRRWEMTFYFFNKSNFNTLIKPSSSENPTDLPSKSIKQIKERNPARVENEH